MCFGYIVLVFGSVPKLLSKDRTKALDQSSGPRTARVSKAATTRRSSASCPAVGTDNTVHTYNVILSKKKLPYQEICPLFSMPMIENSKDFRKI